MRTDFNQTGSGGLGFDGYSTFSPYLSKIGVGGSVLVGGYCMYRLLQNQQNMVVAGVAVAAVIVICGALSVHCFLGVSLKRYNGASEGPIIQALREEVAKDERNLTTFAQKLQINQRHQDELKSKLAALNKEAQFLQVQHREAENAYTQHYEELADRIKEAEEINLKKQRAVLTSQLQQVDHESKALKRSSPPRSAGSPRTSSSGGSPREAANARRQLQFASSFKEGE